MTLTIKRVYNLPPHLSYVSTLPDITQKRKTYVVFLSVVWVAPERTGFGVYKVGVWSDVPLPLHMYVDVFATGFVDDALRTVPSVNEPLFQLVNAVFRFLCNVG